ncbi:MAG: UvrD-helicase domain-containing protein, partial [Planctomycetota bacterium]
MSSAKARRKTPPASTATSSSTTQSPGATQLDLFADLVVEQPGGVTDAVTTEEAQSAISSTSDSQVRVDANHGPATSDSWVDTLAGADAPVADAPVAAGSASDEFVARLESELDRAENLGQLPEVALESVVANKAAVANGEAIPPLLIRASAGTGKTYQLTGRLLKILLQGAGAESILATTFTRKAAGEIVDRVLQTLAAAADPTDQSALQSLRQQVGIPTLSPAVCEAYLAKLMRSIHRLRICTLDSLFSQLARSFPFELGLPPGWRLTDEIEEVWLREQAINTLVDQLETKELRSLLSMLSKGDVGRSVARDLLGVVNAAYGNARGCAADAWDRLPVPTMPDSADLTKAAGELRMAQPKQKRLREQLDASADALESRDLDELVDSTLLVNIALAMRTGDAVKFGNSKFDEALRPTFQTLYGGVRSVGLARLKQQNLATGQVLSLYSGLIDQLKQNRRLLGFDDICHRLADHFENVDATALASRLDGSIDHVLLDEFQDTAPVQWRVLYPLARHASAGGANEVAV